MKLGNCTRSIEKAERRSLIVNTFLSTRRESALETWVLLRKPLMIISPQPVGEAPLEQILKVTLMLILRV